MSPAVILEVGYRNVVGSEQMKAIQILWQRLVDEKGQTCVRCGTTETAVEEAVNKLKGVLRDWAST